MKQSTSVYSLVVGACLAVLLACNGPGAEPASPAKLFSLLDSSQTGIRFVNHLPNRDEFNIYTYRNFYNGAGVAIGDVNQDGLQDVFLTANLESNRLFLNQGDFQFEDISKSAGIGGTRA
ncbi:MAG: VCBS repeat-containing protein, partial [Bacteroidota bacterium]